MRDGYCPSCSREWGVEGLWSPGMVRGLSGGVGEKLEFLLNSVTTGVVTKRHFDNSTGQELNIASPWGLYVTEGINQNKSAH